MAYPFGHLNDKGVNNIDINKSSFSFTVFDGNQSFIVDQSDLHSFPGTLEYKHLINIKELNHVLLRLRECNYDFYTILEQIDSELLVFYWKDNQLIQWAKEYYKTTGSMDIQIQYENLGRINPTPPTLIPGQIAPENHLEPCFSPVLSPVPEEIIKNTKEKLEASELLQIYDKYGIKK